eukprot:NODE_102_length_20354_cov_0.272018.p7 type:complete len:245 gc:universal NODE_102_length_20354_cov_0.272018:11782-12516(+)
MLASSSLNYSIREIESLQNCKLTPLDIKVPELFSVSALDKSVRWVRQLNENNIDLVAGLVAEILTPEIVEPFVRAGFERIVFNYEFAKPFCYCCVAIFRKTQMREVYSVLMKCCQLYFTNRQQWMPLERILQSKRKTNQADVPKMEKKTKMTKRRSFATIYLASALLEVKFLSPSIYIFILRDCLKSNTTLDDLELASLLLETSAEYIVKFQNSDKEKFSELMPRLEQLTEMKLLNPEVLQMFK